MKTLAIQFARFGPYHLARISAAVNSLETNGWKVVGLETAGQDNTYAWRDESSSQNWERHTVFENQVWEQLTTRQANQGMKSTLDAIRPDAVAISGWGSPDSRACLDWCQQNSAHSIVMSETREKDGDRKVWKEFLKHRIVRKFRSGIVGGRSHCDYLIKLGLTKDRIQFGYNVVDNHYFMSEASRIRHSDKQRMTRPYFLASNRFVERKNLSNLIKAFAIASRSIGSGHWNLCLLGDGPLLDSLISVCIHEDLEVSQTTPWDHPQSQAAKPVVYFPGFRQIEDLPRFYAHAGCFIHPALSEPWGLVINEAMASGLPILSSSNVGAAEELVNEGVNGWTFDPNQVQSISKNILQVTQLDELTLLQFGNSSSSSLEAIAPTSSFGEGLLALLEDRSV